MQQSRSKEIKENKDFQEQDNDLGKYKIYSNDFVGPMQPDSMRQADFDSLTNAWKNIHEGKGMTVTGNEEDKAIWDNYLKEGMQASPTFRSWMEKIGNDTSSYPLIVALGNHQDRVLVDSFETAQVDLADLQTLPSDASKSNPNEITRPEAVLHFLAERYNDKTTPLSYVDPIKERFKRSNKHGIDVQNAYRAEHGQVELTRQYIERDSSGKIKKDPITGLSNFVQDLKDGSKNTIPVIGSSLLGYMAKH